MSSIEKDERLTPFPTTKNLQVNHPSDIPANYAPMYDDDVFHEGRSLKDYFLVVYKRLPIILAMTILVTSVVAFYMYRLPSNYESATTMVITLPKQKGGPKESVYINFGYDGNYVNTQLRLLKTPELMREVVLRLGLYKDPNLFGKTNKGFVDSLKSIFSREKTPEGGGSSLTVLTENTEKTDAADINTLTPEEKARVESYTAQLLGTLSIEQIQNTDLVNVKLTSSNPDLIPRVTDMVAETHIQMDAKRATQGQEDAYKDLIKSIEELKTGINQKEAQLMTEMQNNNLPLTGEKGADFNAIRLNTLSTQYLEAMNTRRKLQANYEAAQAAISKGQPYNEGEGKTYADEERLNILKMRSDLKTQIAGIDKQITEAESKVAQLRVTKQDAHPEVKVALALVEKLNEDRKKIKEEGENEIKAAETKQKLTASSETLTNFQSKLNAAIRSENDLKRAYEQARATSNLAGTASTKLTTLNSEIDTERALLNQYVQTQKTMELAISGSRPDNILISSKALRPEGPIGPQRNRNIFIAFFLSFGIGIGLAFLLDYLDDSIKTSDDIGKHLGLPTLALIPHESVLGKRKRKSLPGSENAAKSPSSTALITLEDSRSAMAEAYRHLRTSLLFSSAGKPPQVVLVTSSQPSEGKTTTAINTAITLAQSGADVIIIDCDLRRPRLHQHFAMDNNTGLTNYLSGDKNTEMLLKPYPAYPKLRVITSGPIPPNPAELLSSAEMQELLRDLRGKFNHIVIDSPPAISFADAAILSTIVDGVILVAMAGKSSIQLIKRFKQRLNTIGTRIYGVVLNGIKPDSFEYGYYGYGYDYGYEDNEDESTPRMDDDYETIIRK
jgi:succinoglycan biosynthesis transport protein ExoP